MNRSQTWTKYSSIPIRVSHEVMCDLFQLLFNTVEKQPDIRLTDMVGKILQIVETK